MLVSGESVISVNLLRYINYCYDCWPPHYSSNKFLGDRLAWDNDGYWPFVNHLHPIKIQPSSRTTHSQPINAYDFGHAHKNLCLIPLQSDGISRWRQPHTSKDAPKYNNNRNRFCYEVNIWLCITAYLGFIRLYFCCSFMHHKIKYIRLRVDSSVHTKIMLE